MTRFANETYQLLNTDALDPNLPYLVVLALKPGNGLLQLASINLLRTWVNEAWHKHQISERQ
jgi:hypothetical protein